MSAALFGLPMNPLDSNGKPDSNPTPQPFTGGSNIAPMPVSSAKDNPFTDVLAHVDAFNNALNPKPVQASQSLALFPSVPNPNVPAAPTNPNDPKNPNYTGPDLPPPPSTPVDPRNRPSTPPAGPAATNPAPYVPSPTPAPPNTYSDQNPPPRPPDMNDPEAAADYYRGFAYKNPLFANISNADVNYQRMMALNGTFAAMGHPEWQDIGTWYAATGGYEGLHPTGGPAYGTPWMDLINGGGSNPPSQGVSPASPSIPPSSPSAPPAQTPPVTPPVAPPPVIPPVAPPPATPPPTTPPSQPPLPPATPPAQPPSPPVAPPDIQSLIDMFQKEANAGNGPNIESMLNPMFARQRQLTSDQMRAEASLTPGRLESGGFGQNEGQALADLSGKQSATMANAMQQEQLAKMQQNTQLMSLATTAGMQKYVTDINADLTKFQVNSNADLQKWLDNQDNALKKYGIDTGDLLARYQAELQLRGQQYSADKGVDAAALQAAAAHAAAAAQAAASTQNAQLQYNLGLQGLNVDREKNIGQWILGLLGMGNMDINTLNGILAGLLPGTTVVKP